MIGIIGDGVVGLTLAAFFEYSEKEYYLICRRLPTNFVKIIYNGNEILIPSYRFRIQREIKYISFNLIISCVKRFDVPSVIPICEQSLKQGGKILSIQNGINVEHQYGILSEHVVHAPIVIQSLKQESKLEILSIPLIYLSNEDIMIKKILEGTGIKLCSTNNMYQQLWEKLIFVSTLSGICACYRISIGEILMNSRYKSEYLDGLKEAYAVGKIHVPNLRNDIITEYLDNLSVMNPNFIPSLNKDIHNDKSEVKWLSGEIYKQGLKYKIFTPLHEKWYKSLKNQINIFIN